MGAQQTKYDDLLILHRNMEQHMRVVKGLNSKVDSQQLLNETVTSQQNLTLASSPKGIVGDFAKIKIEPAEEDLLDDHDNQVKPFQKNVKCEDVHISDSVEICSEGAVSISLPHKEDNYEQSNVVPCIEKYFNLPSLEIKREFLELQSVESSLKTAKQYPTSQGNTYLTIHDKSSSAEFNQNSLTTLTETRDNVHSETVNNTNSQTGTKIDKLIDYFDAEDNNQQPGSSSKLVKNPFAFLKRNSNKISVKADKILIECCVNKTIKKEVLPIDEELNITNKNDQDIPFKEEAVQSTININELNIKCENLSPVEAYENTCNNNLDSSLDVNLSNVNSDFEDARSTRSIEKAASSINDSTSSECLKFFSIIEISSDEKKDSPVQKSQLIPKKQKSDNQTSDINKRRSYKTKQKKNLGNVNQEGRKKYAFKKVGRKPKSKYSRKYSEKDSAYISGCPQRNILKKLPKMGIKTRKKGNQAIARKNNFSPTKDDFPKPIKLETPTLCKEQRLAVKLPKPMTIKNELDINIKNIKSYLKPQYQPLVRLKRLKSEELLVPLKSKYVRKNRKFKSTMNAVNCVNNHQMANDSKRDFRIHQAFSLHSCIKFNRLSIDHDQLSFNDHHSTLYTNSMQNNSTNESPAETELKYYTPQELYSIFHSTTPDGSFSGNIDSGVSTSTPTTSHRSFDDNKILLLKIAAERAFINNHLMHFGFSPIQFDLYNNLNELNVFLKFLFGSANTY